MLPMVNLFYYWSVHIVSSTPVVLMQHDTISINIPACLLLIFTIGTFRTDGKIAFNCVFFFHQQACIVCYYFDHRNVWYDLFAPFLKKSVFFTKSTIQKYRDKCIL